jgi:hypothetical protein
MLSQVHFIEYEHCVQYRSWGKTKRVLVNIQVHKDGSSFVLCDTYMFNQIHLVVECAWPKHIGIRAVHVTLQRIFLFKSLTQTAAAKALVAV